MTKAMAYGRTSSITNVGEGKDSRRRQSEAIQKYAEQSGISIMRAYFDEGVSGAVHVMERPAFKSMIEDMVKQGIKTILVESADRFARDLIVQIVGYDKLTAAGIQIVPVNAPDYFMEDTPTSALVRNVLGAIAEFEKSNLVNRLRVAREAKQARGERGVGRLSLAEKLPPGITSWIHDLHVQGKTYEYISQRITLDTDYALTKQQVRKVVQWVKGNGFPKRG